MSSYCRNSHWPNSSVVLNLVQSGSEVEDGQSSFATVMVTVSLEFNRTCYFSTVLTLLLMTMASM